MRGRLVPRNLRPSTTDWLPRLPACEPNVELPVVDWFDRRECWEKVENTPAMETCCYVLVLFIIW